jgi:hypothetical protein
MRRLLLLSVEKDGRNIWFEFVKDDWHGRRRRARDRWRW